MPVLSGVARIGENLWAPEGLGFGAKKRAAGYALNTYRRDSTLSIEVRMPSSREIGQGLVHQGHGLLSISWVVTLGVDPTLRFSTSLYFN